MKYVIMIIIVFSWMVLVELSAQTQGFRFPEVVAVNDTKGSEVCFGTIKNNFMNVYIIGNIGCYVNHKVSISWDAKDGDMIKLGSSLTRIYSTNESGSHSPILGGIDTVPIEVRRTCNVESCKELSVFKLSP